jgi:predicted amidohydrolase
MIVALASPCIASSLDEGLDKIKRSSKASAQGAEIVCFPEAYLPDLRGQDFDVLPFDQRQQERVLHAVAQSARTYAVATILGMERVTEAGRQIATFVIDAQGHIQGYQTKNQLDPTEDQFYVPGNTRRLFKIKGIKFGVVICHEGWRYPATVRWAAVRGAKIVFHPHHTGSDQEGVRLTEWGAASGPYYEKAMMMRSMENTIYFASVNYALRFQESATSLIAPSGRCQAYLPYGQEGILVQAINVEEATGLLATRYAPERYQEFRGSDRPTPHAAAPRCCALGI